jgi:hypothetical protein
MNQHSDTSLFENNNTVKKKTRILNSNVNLWWKWRHLWEFKRDPTTTARPERRALRWFGLVLDVGEYWHGHGHTEHATVFVVWLAAKYDTRPEHRRRSLRWK